MSRFCCGPMGDPSVGESLDCVLDRSFTGRLEHPADLDGGAVVAHHVKETGEVDSSSGDRPSKGTTEVLKKPSYRSLVSRVRRSKEQREHNTPNHAPPVLVPIRVERLWSGRTFSSVNVLRTKRGSVPLGIRVLDRRGRARDNLRLCKLNTVRGVN